MKKIFILMVLLSVSMAGFAQVNFTGSYKLKEIKHVAGPEYSNAVSETLVIKQTGDSLWTGKRGVAMNGAKLVFVSEEGRKVVKSVLWAADKKSLKVTTVIYMSGNDKEVDLTREDTYSMVGGELVINRKSIESNSENWETKGIYTKE